MKYKLCLVYILRTCLPWDQDSGTVLLAKTTFLLGILYGEEIQNLVTDLHSKCVAVNYAVIDGFHFGLTHTT